MRCVRPLRGPGDPSSSGAGLTIGRSYHVLEIHLSPRDTRTRVVDDAGQPTLWMLEGFELVDGSVPPTWHAKFDEDATISLGPKAWQADDFWWSYFNDDSEARATYERELSRMLGSVALNQSSQDIVQ